MLINEMNEHAGFKIFLRVCRDGFSLDLAQALENVVGCGSAWNS